MHEYSIVQALMDQVETQAAAHRATMIRRIHVAIGELAGVDTGLLATAWETFRMETLCAETPLEIRHVAAEWTCRRCSRAVARGQVLQCPDCRLPASLASGDEILLERIEMEVADV